MTLIQRPIILLTTEERATLRNAAELVKEITMALKENSEKGFAAFQRGAEAPEAFWELTEYFYDSEHDHLIP